VCVCVRVRVCVVLCVYVCNSRNSRLRYTLDGDTGTGARPAYPMDTRPISRSGDANKAAHPKLATSVNVKNAWIHRATPIY
jgi:hypothetical protein